MVSKIFEEGLELLALGGKLPSLPNIPFKTMGGHKMWRELANVKGWRVQQNMVTQLCRVLDPYNTRVAWGGYKAMIRDFERILK